MCFSNSWLLVRSCHRSSLRHLSSSPLPCHNFIWRSNYYQLTENVLNVQIVKIPVSQCHMATASKTFLVLVLAHSGLIFNFVPNWLLPIFLTNFKPFLSLTFNHVLHNFLMIWSNFSFGWIYIILWISFCAFDFSLLEFITFSLFSL